MFEKGSFDEGATPGRRFRWQVRRMFRDTSRSPSVNLRRAQLQRLDEAPSWHAREKIQTVHVC